MQTQRVRKRIYVLKYVSSNNKKLKYVSSRNKGLNLDRKFTRARARAEHACVFGGRRDRVIAAGSVETW